MKTPSKALLIIVCSLLYVFAVTYLFEYTVNEASNTSLTLIGIALFILLTWLFVALILKIRKK